MNWSHATMLALSVLIALGAARCFWPKRRNRRVRRAREVARARSWEIVDYSAQYRKQVQWLGDRYLFAKPINRNHNIKAALQ